MLAGRWRTFEDAPDKRRLFLRMLGISGTLFLALLAARLLLPSRLDSVLEVDAGHLLHQWENLAYTAAFVSAAVLQRSVFHKGRRNAALLQPRFDRKARSNQGLRPSSCRPERVVPS